MVQIDPMEYQKFSIYSSRAQSSPSIPVGSTGVIETLRTILDVLKRGQSLDDAILNWNWAFPTVPTLMRSCVSTSGFVRGNLRKAVFAFK